METTPPFDSSQISAEFHGKTLLAWLRHQLPGHSWSQCRQLLATRRVKINGVVGVDEARRLKPGDRVELAAESQPAPRAADVVLRYLDSDLVVIEKPPHLVSTRRPEELYWSLEKRLRDPTADELASLAILQRESPQVVRRRGWRPTSLSRLWRIQRLDRPTSGLLVFARQEAVAQGLIAQFEQHTVEREYQAIVCGTPKIGTIATNLVRDRGDGLRGSTRPGQPGQRAVTHILAVEPLGDFSIVRCRLETGRTHQIRIHLAEQGHPVCGESVYTQKRGGNRVAETSAVPRLALHAGRLAFRHPVTQQPLEFATDWPDDLQAWLTHIKQRIDQPAAQVRGNV